MCKRILALLLALTLCASLSACGGKQEEEAQPGGHELDEYYGWWQYDDYTSVIAFADGNAWSIYAGDGSLSYTGLFEFDGSGIRALDEQRTISCWTRRVRCSRTTTATRSAPRRRLRRRNLL